MLAEVSEASADDVDAAVRAARTAYTRVWSRMSGADRGKYLFRIARILQERAREFAVLETLDNGKPIKEARDVDLPLAAAHFFYHAGWADKLDHASLGPEPAAGRRRRPDRAVELPAADARVEDRAGPGVRQHRGDQARRDHAAHRPALRRRSASRPSCPRASSTSSPAPGATGQAIVDHPGIDKLAFTGSTAVGKMIARSIAGTRKKATLELGGKAANIIFDDAPIDQAVEGIVNGIFFNQGHVCCAGSRILVQESIADELDHRLKRRLATLRVGDPMDKNTDVGAINSRKQLDRIEEMVAVGEAEGAQRWDSGCALPTNGFWFRPTVFSGVSQTHRIAQEEIFGPVVSVLTFRTPAEAVAKANNTPYGLSAGIWTEKGSRILWMADQLRAGVVWANTFNKFDPTSPFGGYKESGYGREGGRHGLEAYVTSGGSK